MTKCVCHNMEATTEFVQDRRVNISPLSQIYMWNVTTVATCACINMYSTHTHTHNVKKGRIGVAKAGPSSFFVHLFCIRKCLVQHCWPVVCWPDFLMHSCAIKCIVVHVY